MTHPTHLIAGTLIGYATGDYATALIVSLAVDIDHLPSMISKKVFKNKNTFLKSILETDKKYEAERGVLHNILSFSIISVVVWFIFPKIAPAFILAYLSHLIMDALDNADTPVLWPFSKISIKGPVKYFSKKELLFAVLMLILLIALIAL